MEESFTIVKKRSLERQRDDLIKEYKAAIAQVGYALDSVSRLRLQRQADDIEKEIRRIEVELNSLAVAPVHDDKPAYLTAVAQQADELVEPESVVAEENVSQPKAVPEPADDSPEPGPKKYDDRPDELAEPEPAPPQENTPDLTALSKPPGIFEVATGFVKQWLWAQFLLWTLVSALSFTSDLGGVLDLTLPTRLLVLGLLVVVGGVVILGISLLPAYRANYRLWDRGLTASLWLIITIALLLLWQTEVHTQLPVAPVTTPTPSPSPTQTLAAIPDTIPTPTGTPDPSTIQTNPTLGNTWKRLTDNMIMVYVPGGTFLMGSEEGLSNERPVHQVTLNSFWLDQTEITNAQYARCVADSGCIASRFANNSTFNKDNYPVVGVDWNDAATYCAWAGGRLPTEAEWEYTARGPELPTYPWGNDAPNCTRANYASCASGTDSVSSYPDGVSWVGAFDMAGNVWEWMSDWYASDYYANSSSDHPQGPTETDRKVLRGGAWTSDEQTIRATYRDAYDPGLISTSVGFRCVQESN